MWSNKEHINSLINCLLFFVAINFLHLGQLLLPIICLILFFDSKGKFIVNNIVTFIILCLFGITFLCFSFKQGFYSTMGLCLPMAYYIGSNINNSSEENIKKVIYIIAFGMASHVVLNFLADIVLDGMNFINSVNHYDIWTLGYVPTTSTATNCIFIISLFYYLLIYEKSRNIKLVGLIILALNLIYDIALGRRTPIFMLVICLVLSLFVDKIVNKNKTINIKPLLYSLLGIFIVLIIIIVIYNVNLFNLKEFIDSFGIVKKFKEYGFLSGRLEIFIDAIKLMPSHLWGGMQIHDILGIQVHDLWMDTFDYAGIVPYVLLLTHTVLFMLVFIRLIRCSKVNSNFKLLIIVLFSAILIQLLLEPIMTGSSIFIIVTIIIEGLLEKLLFNYERE